MVFAAMSRVILGVGIHWLLGVVAVVVTGAVFWMIVLDETFEIRLAKDGTIDFVGLRRTVKIPANEIRGIRRNWYRDDGGSEVRRLLITHTYGEKVLPDFDRAEEFIADVLVLNPSVRATRV